MRAPDYDDHLDRQMHDTFDREPTAQLDPEAHSPADRPPAKPKRDWNNIGTRVRTTRLSDELWNDVKAEATRAGVPTSTIVRDALDAYLDRRP